MTPLSKQQPPLTRLEEAPSTVRRDIFQHLVASADTPTTVSNNNNDNNNNRHVASEDIRLVMELKQVQDEKANALRKVARLQEQIHQLQKHEPGTLETVVQVAEQSGEMAAITWARQQVSNATSQPPVSQVRA
jgi:type IV secretory pathway TrbL component